MIAAAACYQFNLGNYDSGEELAVRAIGDGVPEGATASGLAHVTLAFSVTLLGDVPRANAIVVDAARMLDREVPGSPWTAYTHAMASTLALPGSDSDARAEAEVALRQAREIANPSALAAALCGYGSALADDDHDAALAALDECIELGRRGASPSMFSMALHSAAVVRVRTGDLPRAARDLREGVERCHRLGSRPAFYASVWGGTEILTAFDRWAETGVFEGIVNTAMQGDLARGGDTRRRAAVAQARVAYGSERYDEAVRTGAAMSYDQAVEYILPILDDLIAETNRTRALTGRAPHESTA